MKILCVALLTAMILAACSPTAGLVPSGSDDVIAIASDFPYEGPDRSEGRSAAEGAQFAVEQVGTIGKFRLVFKAFDDSLAAIADRLKASQNVMRMAADPEILGMVGPYNSYIAEAEIPIASQNNLAMVSPSTTSDCLTINVSACQRPPRPGGLSNFFRIAATDAQQATVMADFALNRLFVSKVAVLGDGFPYGEGLADRFSQALIARGGAVVLRQKIGSSTNDFTELLHQIKGRGAQAIYAGGTAFTGTCRVRSQMLSILPDVYFLGGDGLVSANCLKQAGRGADLRMMATLANGAPNADPASKTVVDNYTNSKHLVGGYTFASYDCARILIDAIRRAIAANGGQKPSRQQVIQAVATTRLSGLTGKWSFDPNGDATAPVVSIWRVDHGKWASWRSQTFSPSG